MFDPQQTPKITNKALKSEPSGPHFFLSFSEHPLHFDLSDIDFGSQILIISNAWGPITLRSEKFTPVPHAQRSLAMSMSQRYWTPAFSKKQICLESQSSKMGGGGDTPHGVFNNIYNNDIHIDIGTHININAIQIV